MEFNLSLPHPNVADGQLMIHDHRAHPNEFRSSTSHKHPLENDENSNLNIIQGGRLLFY